MGHSVFGWSYPPGCSGPLEGPDPSPESEKVCGILEDAGVAEPVIERVVDIVEALAAKALRACPECERQAVKAEREAEKAAEEYWATVSQSSPCPHGLEVTDCNSCLIAGDLAYDAARERRMFP